MNTLNYDKIDLLNMEIIVLKNRIEELQRDNQHLKEIIKLCEKHLAEKPSAEDIRGFQKVMASLGYQPENFIPC